MNMYSMLVERTLFNHYLTFKNKLLFPIEIVVIAKLSLKKGFHIKKT